MRRIHGRSSILVRAAACAALIAGCASDTTKDSGTIAWSQPAAATAPGSAGAAPAQVIPAPGGPPLNWQTRLSSDTVLVDIHDPNAYYRVERVELVGPSGQTIAAHEINRTTNRASGDYYRGYGGGPSVGVGGWGGSHHGGVGIGLDFPLGGSSATPPPEPIGTVTSASIKIPDPALYRQTAANWVVRITVVDRSNQSQAAVIPAPRPAG